MHRNTLISTGIILFSTIFAVTTLFSLHSLAQTAQPTQPPITVCTDHGGPNCSIINEDATVVCNDGTIDEPFTIYAVPQCHKALEDMANRQSDFMAKSGCFPPSEMTCTDEQSYRNLSQYLTTAGLRNSELGKNELAQCHKDMATYKLRSDDYQKCLVENNSSPSDLPSNKLVLPILKSVFCPIFYGDESSYDQDIDLCVCDDGYFMSDGKCTEASLICQSKYGRDYSAENGNCRGATINIAVPTPNTTLKKTLVTSQSEVIFSPIQTFQPPQSKQIPPAVNQPETGDDKSEINTNFITRFFNTALYGIKKILRLF